MNKLHHLGFYDEIGLSGMTIGPIAIAKQGCWNTDSSRIADYLARCPLFMGSPGLAGDYLGAPNDVAGSSGFATDGTWVWPESLEYFVRKYGIELPDEFIEHARNRGFDPPAADTISFATLEL